jgi:hypothetical protein
MTGALSNDGGTIKGGIDQRHGHFDGIWAAGMLRRANVRSMVIKGAAGLRGSNLPAVGMSGARASYRLCACRNQQRIIRYRYAVYLEDRHDIFPQR